jgi:hypothetical protein
VGVAATAVVLALAALPTPSLAEGWAGPKLISAERPAEVEVFKDGSVHRIASVHLPKGRWLAIATTNIRVHGISSCSLGRGTTTHRQSMTDLEDPNPFGGSGSGTAPTFIQAVTIPARGGTVAFSCQVIGGPSPKLVVGHTRLDALRVGKLTDRDLDSGVKSTKGTGPLVVVHGHGDGATFISGADPTTVARIHLPAGRWWVQAVVPLSRSIADDGPDQLYTTCALGAGDGGAGARTGLSQKMLRNSASLQTAARLATAGDARVRCRLVEGHPKVRAQGVRIVAVRIGTLITQRSGTVTTDGSGKPVLAWAERSAGVDAPDVDVFTPLLALPAAIVDGARWRVAAMTQLTTMTDTWLVPRCRLMSDPAHTWVSTLTSVFNGGGSVSESMVADLTGSATSSGLACTGSPSYVTDVDERQTYSQTWLTGLKLATWTKQ